MNVKKFIKLANRASQKGATLVIALVMLVVLTLLVISAMRTSTTNLRIVGNMQMQEEASTAAQQAIEQVISNNFTVSPAASSVAVTVGGTTYTANVTAPTCLGSTALQNSTPNLPSECISSGAAQNTGIVFSSGVAATGTSRATIHQGVNLSVPAGTGC